MFDYSFISRAATKVVHAFPESVNFPDTDVIPYIEQFVRNYYSAMGMTIPDDTVLEIALTIHRRPER